MNLMEFSDWLTKKYSIWRGDAIGNEKSITEFGKLIGADKTSLTLWMRNKRTPKMESIKKIGALYPEVYEILGVPRPPDDLLAKLPPRFRDILIAAGNEITEILTSNKIDPSSPEAEAVVMSVMAKHGFKQASTTTPGKSG